MEEEKYKEVMKWTRSFERVIRKMPDGIEVIVLNGSMDIAIEGTLEHMCDHGDYKHYSESSITSILTTNKILPYGESM